MMRGPAGALALALCVPAASAGQSRAMIDALGPEAPHGVRIASVGNVRIGDPDGNATLAALFGLERGARTSTVSTSVIGAFDGDAAGTVGVGVSRSIGRARLRVSGGAAHGRGRGWPSATWLGAAIARGHLSLSVTSNILPGSPATYRDTLLLPADTSGPAVTGRILERAATPRRLHADVEVSYRTRLDRFDLSASAGQRIGDVDERTWWVRAASSTPIAPGWALGASIGRDPGTPWLDTRARLTGSLFVRVDLRAAVPPITPTVHHGSGRIDAMRITTTPGGTRFVVVAPAASLVEITGDFNGWTPVALRADASGAWFARLDLAAGIYHVSVRIDGGPWLAPPGLPAVADELGGESGVFEVLDRRSRGHWTVHDEGSGNRGGPPRSAST